MRYRWLRSLALSLGYLVVGVTGIGFTPRAQADPPAPVVQSWPPAYAPAAESKPAAVQETAPAATLDRPVPLRSAAPVVDSQVRPTGLFNRHSESVVYSPAAGVLNARPLPAGPPIEINGSPLPAASAPLPAASIPAPAAVPESTSTWRPAPGTVPTQATPPSTLLPTPSAAPLAGPLAGPGIGGAPIGHPTGDGCVAPGGMDCCGDGCCAPGCCAPGCCGDGCCGGGWGGWGRGCCFGNRWLVSAEYLLWFIRGQSVPPLLTSGTVGDNPPGALGQPGTNVLFGGGNLSNNPYSGVRLRGVYWFNDTHGLGLDVGGFILGGGANRFSQSSTGNPFLARPFFNTSTGAEDIEAVATPNGLTGTFTAVSTFFLYGAEANLRRNFLCGCNWFVDGFVGWRLLGLNESLAMTENLAVVNSQNPNLPAGSTFVVNDRFATSNLFNGGQIGGIAGYQAGKWFFLLRQSVGVGGTTQNVSISGSTITGSPFSGVSTSTGGLLAQSSNIGSYTRAATSFIEETTFSVGYQFTPHIRAFVGYNFLYWTNVVRPGNQIDTNVNPNLIPPAVGGGSQRPTFNFNSSDFWVQGVNFGMAFTW